MRVVLAGASGLIGHALSASLRAGGHEVVQLVRRDPSSPDEHRWDPVAGRIDPQSLAGADAVVCLSGVGVGDRRWTSAYKDEILRSRVDTVGTLARSLAEHGSPNVLIAASAVGYYGDAGDAVVDERTGPGTTFLAGVCRQWEAAATPAADAGVRVVHLRTGLVLAHDGGLLPRLRTIVNLGLGGRLGSGRQYMPWISLADEVAAIQFLLTSELAGPVNVTAPHPVTNAELTRALGAALHRPTPWIVPGLALRAVLGEFAGEVLGGQRAVPRALTDAGFTFTYPDLADALRVELASG